jgi:hypothetical protein
MAGKSSATTRVKLLRDGEPYCAGAGFGFFGAVAAVAVAAEDGV